MRLFRMLQRVDDKILDSMDTYCSLLKITGDFAGLTQTCHRLLQVDAHRPEPWGALCMAAEMRGRRRAALQMINRALALDSTHVFAHLLKYDSAIG